LLNARIERINTELLSLKITENASDIRILLVERPVSETLHSCDSLNSDSTLDSGTTTCTMIVTSEDEIRDPIHVEVSIRTCFPLFWHPHKPHIKEIPHKEITLLLHSYYYMPYMSLI